MQGYEKMKMQDLNEKIEKEKKEKVCPDCQGRGYICKVFGETKTCLKCLRAGRLG